MRNSDFKNIYMWLLTKTRVNLCIIYYIILILSADSINPSVWLKSPSCFCVKRDSMGSREGLAEMTGVGSCARVACAGSRTWPRDKTAPSSLSRGMNSDWTSYLIPLGLHLLVYQIGTIIHTFTLKGWCDNPCKELNTGQALHELNTCETWV